MKAYIFSVTLTGLAFVAFGAIGSFVVFFVYALAVAVASLPTP
jgi:hypothetical protein